MRVRESTPHDEAFVLRLAVRFAEFPLPPWLERGTVVEGTARQLRRAFQDATGDTAILIAERDGEPQGFVWVYLTEDFYSGERLGKISEIAVSADGTGAGSALIEAAEAWVRDRGARRMVLNVMEENRNARRFYERRGYGPEYTMMAKRLDD